ncbi:DNA-binding protein [Halogeometricum borinquense]|uniref:DNA-binding protein n=1 Tax=Halogeometricum borinquense TaxID=60847 RepID=A0A6C0UJX1_9EURY|nr:helix-turn-helix domain-containing protein [Halogeometricum borinquense]QIB73258.1 DNA-binding protein [Halogeometricum borinquense]QIQ77347.1 DNA-binding protein [Halogeometricum borinquense]
MASIAEFTLPAPDFPLGRIFERWPEATLELDRVVPNDDTVMPYFWVTVPNADGDLAAIRAEFDGLPELRSAVLMEELGDKGLFRAEWEPEYMGIMRAISVTGVTVLSATGSADGWTFELRAMEAEQFSQFHHYCTEHDINVTLARLSQLSEATTGSEYDLTPEQAEALRRAYKSEYYDDPRGTDQKALAEELGISRQAFASRLRRGYRNLIRCTLIRDTRTDD